MIPLGLVVAAFGTVILSAIGRCPLWVPVLLVVLERLLAVVGPR